MEAIFNFLKAIFYYIAISIGIIVPVGNTVSTQPIDIKSASPIISSTSSVPSLATTTPQKVIVNLPVEPKISPVIPPKTSVSVPDTPVVVNRVLSELDLKNKVALTSERIITLTNIERAKYSLPPLVFNEKLTIAANIKAKDMIAKQYFAHESPDGTGIEQLAIATNYKYSLIGENLAMGDFISSEDVVLGWMNSPGHRANILKPTFKEIGVSALIGLSGGRNVWYAVQEFGRPPPSCTLPDPNLEEVIKSSNQISKEIGLELSRIKINIESGTFSMSDVKSLIEQYNILVNKSNILRDKIKELVTVYNAAVKAYNECVSAESTLIGA